MEKRGARWWLVMPRGEPFFSIGMSHIDSSALRYPDSGTRWRGPLFDPKRLDSQAGREELSALASRYYRVTHDAIPRYDRNHLILGDRHEARAAARSSFAR